ncbi:recombinase family protein [uncultured Aliiroseovarius sp.]|uniref:recombinase family protein n=1 Tax=uncultured Aliiroseovarius sp. TaxID=1658783 RepID=UPI0026373056|nr:recombinase family protein [uncultured Aliiroseovarius sp.]
MTKTILYARVSTSDQDADIQRAQAEAAGFHIDDVVMDEETSGLTTILSERAEGRRLFDILREGDTLLVRWVDRLGRNYQDVTDTIRHFMRKGVVIKTVINGLTFDGATKDPMQEAVRDALIAFMAATAQAQAEATKEAQKVGIEKAKKEERYLGRKPSFTRKQFEIVTTMLNQDKGPTAIARATAADGSKPLSRQTILRIKEDPLKAEAILNKWGLTM